MTNAYRNKALAVAGLGLIILVGAATRAYQVGSQSITHIEIYTPGIDLPRSLAEPPLPWLTPWEVVIGCMKYETRPGLYYLLMLPWTKLVGTDVISLRLPSVVFGVASIPLVFFLARREGRIAAGLVAAAMFALNGHHIFWSQLARGYVLACFLGLVSTAVLYKLTERAGRAPLALALYCAATLAGLGIEIFYWPVFLTQILWVTLGGLKRPAIPGLLRWQLLIWLAASPLLTLAAYQSRRPSYASGATLPFLTEFLQFGFLFEPDIRIPLSPVARAGTFVLPLLALLLVGVGLLTRSEAKVEADGHAGPPVWLTAFTAAAALALIVPGSLVAYMRSWETAGRIMATGLFPVVLFLLDHVVRRWWPGLHAWVPDLEKLLPGGPLPLCSLLAVVPITMIVVLSQGIPLLISRGGMLWTPYLLVTASRGLVALVERQPRWLPVAAVLVLAHIASVDHFHRIPKSPRDYKALSRELAPRIAESDLIFVEGNHWQTTPIFYYLKPDRYQFVGKDYAEEIARRPTARVWAVTWHGHPMPAGMVDALRDRDPCEEIQVWGARAVLYTAPGRGANDPARTAPAARPQRSTHWKSKPRRDGRPADSMSTSPGAST